MNKRLKDRIESDKIITVWDKNGKAIILSGNLTEYGKKLQQKTKTGGQR